MSEWLRASQVAEMFGVGSKTVTSWARKGKLPYTKTLGGHRRYSRSDVEALLVQRPKKEA